MPKKMIMVRGLKPLSRLGRDAGWTGPPSVSLIGWLSAKSVMLAPLVNRTLIIGHGFDGWMTVAELSRVVGPGVAAGRRGRISNFKQPSHHDMIAHSGLMVRDGATRLLTMRV